MQTMQPLKVFLISLIRPLFIEWNDGLTPSLWLERFWSERSPAELYTILSNFQRLTGRI
jgi:hypothetical protein